MIKKKVKHLLANKDKAIQYPLVDDPVGNVPNTAGNGASSAGESDSDSAGDEENSAVCNIS